MAHPTNRLAKESSPYLKQHQHNPVDWYPWGEEALKRAKTENKPILLSIGYSACHWCHVMERESFENEATAKVMNDHFISIKVDREERPDLDQIYQNVAQAMTRSGGWPLTVFLTPDLKPFFGGTYFPPEDRWGRPGFPRLLQALADAYKGDLASVNDNAEKLTDFIRSLEQSGKSNESAALTPEFFESSARALLSEIDWQNGGFGSAPKFPNTMMLDFLWRSGGEDSKRAVILSLVKMASGGIYDQLGGGFSRYSVDETWSVPHFEKMLYDNALLLRSYSQVLLSGQALTDSERSLFVAVVGETVEYLLREMRSTAGGFFAAQDADSEGEEGKFFVWDLNDLDRLLTDSERAAVIESYGVTKAGNFEHRKTVLYLVKSERENSEALKHAKKKLFEARKKRISPLTDDKILAAWNGLAISGLAWASAALRANGEAGKAEQAWLAARGAFDFVCEKLTRSDGRLYSAWQAGAPHRNAYLDDYAFLASAALDLARFDANPGELVEQAAKWVDVILTHFKDKAAPGYFFTSDDHESLIQRPKSIYDQAIPSGTSTTVLCLIALSEVLEDGRAEKYRIESQEQLSGLLGSIGERSFGYGELLSAALLAQRGPRVVGGDNSTRLVIGADIYRKSATGPTIVCHRGVCSPA